MKRLHDFDILSVLKIKAAEFNVNVIPWTQEQQQNIDINFDYNEITIYDFVHSKEFAIQIHHKELDNIEEIKRSLKETPKILEFFDWIGQFLKTFKEERK
jgi:hypothetical protein